MYFKKTNKPLCIKLCKLLIKTGSKSKALTSKKTPQKPYWGQADWFFDGEGVGLHYQANQITKDAPQLDIYLTTEQTKKILQPEVYEQMF